MDDLQPTAHAPDPTEPPPKPGGVTRSVDDLAADVQAGLDVAAVRGRDSDDEATTRRAKQAASELVALVGTLTQERQERLDADQPVFVPGDAPKSMFARWCDERERAEAAEAALADMRRALEWYAERRNYVPPAGSNPAYDLRTGWVGTQDAFDGEGPGARARSALAAAGSAPEEEGK